MTTTHTTSGASKMDLNNLPVSDENYNLVNTEIDKVIKKLKRPQMLQHVTYSPNTGFGLIVRKNDRRVVVYMGSKKNLETYVQLEAWSNAAMGYDSGRVYEMVKFDDTIHIDHHFEANNNYSYIRD